MEELPAILQSSETHLPRTWSQRGNQSCPSCWAAECSYSIMYTAQSVSQSVSHTIRVSIISGDDSLNHNNENIKIFLYIFILYTYLYNTQLLKNCLKLNPLKIQQDVTSLSGGG